MSKIFIYHRDEIRSFFVPSKDKKCDWYAPAQYTLDIDILTDWCKQTVLNVSKMPALIGDAYVRHSQNYTLYKSWMMFVADYVLPNASVIYKQSFANMLRNIPYLEIAREYIDTCDRKYLDYHVLTMKGMSDKLTSERWKSFFITHLAKFNLHWLLELVEVIKGRFLLKFRSDHENASTVSTSAGTATTNDVDIKHETYKDGSSANITTAIINRNNSMVPYFVLLSHVHSRMNVYYNVTGMKKMFSEDNTSNKFYRSLYYIYDKTGPLVKTFDIKTVTISDITVEPKRKAPSRSILDDFGLDHSDDEYEEYASEDMYDSDGNIEECM